MAHALDGEGNLVAVGDGLGFPIEQWQIGDRLIETHRLVLPEDDETIPPALTLETGGYWLDSMERWSIDGAATSIDLATVLTGKSP
jgi:hypothetical protein